LYGKGLSLSHKVLLFPIDDLEMKDILSVKYAKCERIKLQSNIILNSSTGVFNLPPSP
jgi:hypothetical protein